MPAPCPRSPPRRRSPPAPRSTPGFFRPTRTPPKWSASKAAPPGGPGGATNPTPREAEAGERSTSGRPQFPPSYPPNPTPPIVIRNATIMTATGQEIANGSLLMSDGKIVAIGKSVDAPADAAVVDGTGKYVKIGRASCRERV